MPSQHCVFEGMAGLSRVAGHFEILSHCWGSVVEFLMGMSSR